MPVCKKDVMHNDGFGYNICLDDSDFHGTQTVTMWSKDESGMIELSSGILSWPTAMLINNVRNGT